MSDLLNIYYRGGNKWRYVTSIVGDLPEAIDTMHLVYSTTHNKYKDWRVTGTNNPSTNQYTLKNTPEVMALKLRYE